MITEAYLREELRGCEPKEYRVPEGKMLSPAAREYLQQRKIKIAKAGAPGSGAPAPSRAQSPAVPVTPVSTAGAKYLDDETGAFFAEKPEHMAQLTGNVLVPKWHPRIVFRGKLDSLQAQVVLLQATLQESGGNSRLIEDLNEILLSLREIMRCDALGEPYQNRTFLGFDHAGLRERSHNPAKYFQVKQMVPPDYTMGKVYALLNCLRTAVRETEVAAAMAFREGRKCTQPEILEEFNCMSSAVHVMMCMYQAGMYGK